jgi:integrase/recombinase XerD
MQNPQETRPQAPKPLKALPLTGDRRDPDSLYQHLLRYLAHLTERNYSPWTVERLHSQLRDFIVWGEGQSVTRPQHIDRPKLEAYQRYLAAYRQKSGKPLCADNHHLRFSAIRFWLRWMVKQGRLLYNPATDLDLPRKEKRLPKAILSASEMERVLAAPDVRMPLGLRDRAILETFYSTGMRRAELAGLKVWNIDTERGTVMIRQGKGKKDRLIPIGDRALLWIARYRDRVRPGLVVGRDEGILFLGLMGEAVDLGDLTDLVAEYVKQAHIKKPGSCHLLRHTMATLMLENGADTRLIQEMLGHASLDTTQIYTQMSIRNLKKVHTAAHPGKPTPQTRLATRIDA